MPARDQANPYAVTTLEIGEPIRDDVGPVSKLTRWMIFIAMPLMIFGVALAFIDIETIVGSAPVMLTWGAILLFLTRRQRTFQWFAIACCLFPVVVFLIIFLMSWSPSDAQHPISILCALFVAAMIFGCLVTFGRLKGSRDSQQFEPRTIETAGGPEAERLFD